MLTLSAALPEVHVPTGTVLVSEGEPGGPVWVLVSGSLRVTKGGVQVNAITRPGAFIGEVSVLLGSPFTATVEATDDCVLRHAVDGAAWLRSDGEIATFVAIGLAERLDFVTTYLADLRHQYGDAPGLAMVPDVLRRLAERQGPTAQPGSLRDPDPEY